MAGNLKRDAFDRLVAGLSAEDRSSMLENINRNLAPSVELSENEILENEKSVSLHAKYMKEAFLYRFFIWIRSIFYKKDAEKIYNDDMIAVLARRVNKNHPGLVNHKIKVLDSIFYDQLRGLKEAADFFKPYFALIEDNPGDFYVFLSSFITPELVDEINSKADPFSNDFSVEPTPELKKNLMKKLDEILEEMRASNKSILYESISALHWLKEFSFLPLLHFVSQFTNLAENVFTCPYKNAIIDFDRLAAVFTNAHSPSNELLEIVFLFSQRKNLTDNASDGDIERAVKEFMASADQNLGKIQIFMSGIPVLRIGRIINNDFDWSAGNISGAEDWNPIFRSQWRKIIDLRWTDWIRERKKNSLSVSLLRDFDLHEFPVMRERPWQKLPYDISFSFELTGGFLSWFADEKFEEYDDALTEILTEGVFERNQNKTEFSDGFNIFIGANKNMLFLLEKLSNKGEIGSVFLKFKEQRLRSFQIQNQINSMMKSVENEIHQIASDFIKSGRILEAILHGFLDSDSDGIHFPLQNIATIKGHQNGAWRHQLEEIKKGLSRCVFYLLELEPIDEVVLNEK